MRANGYGASLEYDGTTITILPGRVAARIAGTQRIEVPVADVVEVKYTPPRLGGTFNGSMRFKVRTPDLATLSGYGGRAPVPPEGTEEYAVWVRQGVMTPEALVVHWRKKDSTPFDAIHVAIAADLPGA